MILRFEIQRHIQNPVKHAFFFKKLSIKASENESNMFVQRVLNVGPTSWTRLRQCVQHVGLTFGKCNDIISTSLIACDCVAFESFFYL